MQRGRPRTVLTPAMVQEIKRLYAEKDDAGRQRYSQIAIADIMGIGETTVNRAIRSVGGYRYAPEPLSELQVQKRSKESLARLLADNPDLAVQASTELSAEERMARAIAEEKVKQQVGDKLLNELTGESSGK